MRTRSGRARAVGALAVAAAVVAAGSVGSAGAASKADCGDVTINENSWVGSTANVYVLKGGVAAWQQASLPLEK